MKKFNEDVKIVDEDDQEIIELSSDGKITVHQKITDRGIRIAGNPLPKDIRTPSEFRVVDKENKPQIALGYYDSYKMPNILPIREPFSGDPVHHRPFIPHEGIPRLRLGGYGSEGQIVIWNKDNKPIFIMDGGQEEKALLKIGGDGKDGHLAIHTADNKENIHLGSSGANVWAGGGGQDGDLRLFPPSATNLFDWKQARIHLNGEYGAMRLGGNGQDGHIRLFQGNQKITDHSSQAVIHIDGEKGDIVLKNADCAEEFDTSEENIDPGSVMVIEQSGKTTPSNKPYDKKVIGIVSGAGDYKPGIILDRQMSDELRVPIAVSGKVYCKVTAEENPIEFGDLLTTSSVSGCAMKATNPQESFGAVIGKSLGSMDKGTGLIPVMVSLQ